MEVYIHVLKVGVTQYATILLCYEYNHNACYMYVTFINHCVTLNLCLLCFGL